MIDAFWNNLGKGARAGLVAGVMLIIAAMVLSLWFFRTEYQTLFSDMSQEDAGAMITELDHMKVPYRIGDNGTSILVDKDIVHQTRLKLMSKELPLHGTLGFELFNNTDFGMTEFAQKINYQRALQGEITRTILSLSEIQSARVHLALPEEGLFKHASSVPKAAITLVMKRGQILRPEQVSGIQRLVSAAVPGISIADVTIVDQHGVALTRLAKGDSDTEGSSGRLQLKKETESYLSRKAVEVLDRAFGPGQALVTVDVTLDMDQIKTTTEDVVAPPAKNGQAQAGTIVREKEVVREGSAPLDSKAGSPGGSSQRDTEYSVGRRIENVIAMPGSISRVAVVAVVRKPLDGAQVEKLKNVLAGAVGASVDRGDTIVVQPLNALGVIEQQPTVAPTGGLQNPSARDAQNTDSPQDATPQAMGFDKAGNPLIILILSGLLFLVIVMVAAIVLHRNRSVPREVALTDLERESALAQLRAWMNEPMATKPGGGL